VPNGIRAAIARGRHAEREEALSSAARALLLFIQISERDGLKEAQRIFARIVRLTRHGPRPRRKGTVSRNKRKLHRVMLVSFWGLWKAQHPRGTKEQFARWFKDWPHKGELKYLGHSESALIKQLDRAKRA
jgi:hypothetical protein